MTAEARVAVLGLGTMGGGIARRLLERGVRPAVWNRSPGPAREVAELGARHAASPAEAAHGADLVLACLADAAATEAVLLGPDGALRTGPLEGVLASASTVAPEVIDRLRTRTGRVLDLGLLGNGRHARSGELRVFAGGGAEDLESARPVLELIAKQIVHVGGPGDGMRLKLLMNTLMGVQVQAMAEALALGEASGLDRSAVLAAVTDSGFAAPVMAFKARRLAQGHYAEPDFRLRLMAKDLDLAAGQAAALGRRLPVLEAAAATHREAVALGDGELDCAAVVRTVRAGAPAGAGRAER
jgi:3-hydroxyisobutyrate dehydrogenase-like beta-hydroxyacid dehydrogenase